MPEATPRGRTGRRGGPEAAARRVELILLDVDGVLTDGGLYYVGDGRRAVRFDVRDGLGIVRARNAGLRIGLLSSRDETAVRQRATELKIDDLLLGVADKRAAYERLLARLGLAPSAVCYMGDDLVDLPVLEAVGFPVTVPEAPQAVLERALYVTRNAGGRGAVREVIDLVLAARGLTDAAPNTGSGAGPADSRFRPGARESG